MLRGFRRKGLFMCNYPSDVQQWIADCEANFTQRLFDVADRLLSHEQLKLIRLAGPTCSGKTTFANLLRDRFAQQGKRLHLISIDDFFYDKEILHARVRTESGALDYDSVKTIDLDALTKFTRDIFLEDVADCPIFDFKLGKRIGFRKMESRDDDIFLFEGIQVLYPEVNALFQQYGGSIGIYIAPQSDLRVGDQILTPNEIRLLRRLVRDSHFRGTPPEKTFTLWTGVRQNEERNIFPYEKDCQYRVDSTMPYELGILKPFLFDILPTVSADHPNREQAEAILKQLEPVTPISDTLLPPDSLYQEFV